MKCLELIIKQGCSPVAFSKLLIVTFFKLIYIIDYIITYSVTDYSESVERSVALDTGFGCSFAAGKTAVQSLEGPS